MTRGAPGNANLYPCQMASLSTCTGLFGQLLVILLQLFVMLFQFVSSILLDLRKDFRSDPSFESFGRFELVGEDECVKSGFVDDDGRLVSMLKCSHFGHTSVFFVNVHCNRLCRIGIPQNRSHILTHEICFTIHHTSSDLSKLLVLENCQILHHRGQ